MAGDAVVFLFDPDEQMLANHSLPLLRDDFMLSDHDLELKPFSNRNDLLSAVAAEQRPSLALIDLQLDDRRDQNWSGHRIIETVRLHPALWRTCRPMAFTVHVNEDICRLLQEHGAWGVVCRRLLEVPAEDRSRLRFPDRIRQVLLLPTVAPDGQQERFWVMPDGAETLAGDDGGNGLLLRAIARIFNRKADLSRQQWMILRYYADGAITECCGWR
jgi:hypothetical protein